MLFRSQFEISAAADPLPVGSRPASARGFIDRSGMALYDASMSADDQAPQPHKKICVDKTTCESYETYLAENYRSPSRGGNSKAWHSHVLIIGGDKYSFQAAHRGKFVHKNETVSFEWQWDPSGKYRNIDRNTVIAWSAAGEDRKSVV